MFQNTILKTIAGVVALLTAPAITTAKPLNVVTDIAPIQMIVAAVTGELQSPFPLIDVNISSHDFALRPSDVGTLRKADLIIWLGPDATPGLAKLMQDPALQDSALDVSQIAGTASLDLRHSGMFDSEEEGQHEEHHHADPHSWLYPENAQHWAMEIALELTSLDPQNAAIYQQNARQFVEDIESTTADIEALFANAPAIPFVQFHDAFQYFEDRFALVPLGTATADDEETTSLGTIAALKSALSAYPKSCLFLTAETQHAHATILLEVEGVTTQIIDPVGRTLSADQNTYPDLLMAIAVSFGRCFSGER